jgi:hypothetical protein
MLLPALLLLAVPAPAQRVEVGAAPAASAAAGSAAAAGATGVTAIPFGVASPALAPSAAASAPEAPGSPAAAAPAALPASAISVIDPASLPETGTHYTSEEWAKLTASVPGDGARAVLRSMHHGSSAELTLTMDDGETLQGRFLGVAGDKLAFSSGGKLLGVAMNGRGISEVKRLADVWFDGGSLRPEEVVVHSRPPVADPFKDLAAFKGRTLEIDARDHGDAKRWTAQTLTGRLTKADGNEIQLETAKGTATLWKEDQQVDSVKELIPHYDSRHQVSHLAAVNDILLPGTPVEVEILKRPAAKGLFRGVREDRQGSYVLLEVPNADGSTTMRAYRDAVSIKTQGYKAGAMMDRSITLY